MKLFAEAFPKAPIAKQPVSQLPWGQIIRSLQMVLILTCHPDRYRGVGQSIAITS